MSSTRIPTKRFRGCDHTTLSHNRTMVHFTSTSQIPLFQQRLCPVRDSAFPTSSMAKKNRHFSPSFPVHAVIRGTLIIHLIQAIEENRAYFKDFSQDDKNLIFMVKKRNFHICSSQVVFKDYTNS